MCDPDMAHRIADTLSPWSQCEAAIRARQTSQHMDDIRVSSCSSSVIVNVAFPPDVEGCGLPPPTEVRGQGEHKTDVLGFLLKGQ